MPNYQKRTPVPGPRNTSPVVRPSPCELQRRPQAPEREGHPSRRAQSRRPGLQVHAAVLGSRHHARRKRAVHGLGQGHRRRPVGPVLPRRLRTLAENIEAVKLAEKAGADIVLLSYPPNFWPTSEQEIFDYTKAFCDATELAVLLFPIPLWGFERVDPAGMSVAFVRRLLDACPNIVAIKAEQGFRCRPACARCTTTSATRSSSAARSRATASRS